MSGGFQSRVILVTGASRGLGRAIALGFARAGGTVVGTYLSNEEAAESFREELERENLRGEIHKLDVRDFEAVEKFYRSLEERHPKLDVLVNNSGIRRDGVLAMMPPADWDEVLDTNLDGCYRMSKFAVLNMMRHRYGRILLITSPMAHMGFKGQTNYAASKAGQIGLMRSLCKEVASRGITVNCVSPGFVETDLIADLPEKLATEYRALVPMKRFGTPEEVASAVLFLASSQASYISGSVLDVTGGL
ncbi:MAG: 3-oxoacyl-ACP reductase FabG [Planctomycetes bacterium]|nr:3-oxoacyl-ACP reductase FabG [Planctomycetota bacterium]